MLAAAAAAQSGLIAAVTPLNARSPDRQEPSRVHLAPIDVDLSSDSCRYVQHAHGHCGYQEESECRMPVCPQVPTSPHGHIETAEYRDRPPPHKSPPAHLGGLC